MPWFPLRGNVRVFQEVSLPQLERFQPQALAGCVAALRLLAQESLRRSATWPSLTHGVLVLTAAGASPLYAVDRDLFWTAFQVPVWEQCRCWDGSLYAEECAAREGLHLRGGSDVTPSHTIILHERCACGDPTPRLIAVPDTVKSAVEGLAATAPAGGDAIMTTTRTWRNRQTRQV